MKIDRIYIGDFGIFRNSIIESIGSGIVLIGGRNRAGKSTFMEVLRNLAWGFPKGGALPPPNLEYFLESDIISDDGERYNLKIQGYSDPKLYPASEVSNMNLGDIYNIDKYTYKELYTISLNELNNLSESNSELQAVLLGAGFMDAAHIPEIIKDFSKEAERIGGKRGNPSTKMFKAFSSIISAAVEDREKALKESNEYVEKETILKRNIDEVKKLRETLETIENNIIILDILRENHGDIRRYKELDNILDNKTLALCINYNKSNLNEARNLKERYTKVLKDYDENCSVFRITVKPDLTFKDILIKNKDIILKLSGELSGFRERLNTHNINLSSFEEDKSNIIVDVHRINGNLNGSFKEIMDIKCDDLEIGEISKLETDLREADRTIEEWNNKKSNLISQIKIYEDMGGSARTRRNNSSKFINILLISLLVLNSIILFYGVLCNFNSSIYFVVPLFLLTTALVYLSTIWKNKSNMIMSKREVEERLLRIKSELEASENSLKIVKDKRNEITQKIHSFCRVLKIDENTPPLSIRDYIISFQSIKSRIMKLSIEKKNIDEAQNRLKNYTENVLGLLTKLGMAEECRPDVEDYNEYIYKVSEIVSWLPTVSKLEDSLKKLEIVEKSIKKLIGGNCANTNIEETLDNFIEECMHVEKIIEYKLEHDTLKKSISRVVQSERVRIRLSSLIEGKKIEEPFEKLLYVFSNYSSFKEIDLQYEKLKSDKELLKRKINELTEEIQKLKNEVNGILISDKIRNTQETIDYARGGMRSLAEKYAVYAAASFILDKVYKNFMDKTQNSLLRGSSDILKAITGGEYVNILPPLEIQSVDFRTVLKDGHICDSSNTLSRATKEQLFLAVRLNRIKQNLCKLPVIIDDSFVNFDTIHIKHTLEIISELSKTNQVFILTCHPTMVEYVSNLNSEIQYWKLANGQFSNLDRDSLKNYLSLH